MLAILGIGFHVHIQIAKAIGLWSGRRGGTGIASAIDLLLLLLRRWNYSGVAGATDDTLLIALCAVGIAVVVVSVVAAHDGVKMK